MKATVPKVVVARSTSTTSESAQPSTSQTSPALDEYEEYNEDVITLSKLMQVYFHPSH